jgi:DNA-binding transcriptional LysR family regulator
MEIREIEAFLVLAEELHFGRTAARLYVSPARVSQLIRGLERRIGGCVVERTSRVVRLTPIGEQLLRDAGPAYERLGRAVTDAQVAARRQGGVLRLGVWQTIRSTLASGGVRPP